MTLHELSGSDPRQKGEPMAGTNTITTARRIAPAFLRFNWPTATKLASHSLLRSASAALTASVLTISSAQSTVLPPAGGPGGGNFVAECAGQYLVGVSLRTGGWVDAIAPLCASFLPAQGKFDKWKRGPRKGGFGGSPLLKDAACPADRYVSGITIGLRPDSKYLDYVLLFCGPVKDRSAVTKVCAASRRCGDIPSHDQSCPAGEAATGIHGRYGAYVDSLGLICGRKPELSTMSRREIYEKIDEAKRSRIERGKHKRIERIIQERGR
jgi:hypothetical protein